MAGNASVTYPNFVDGLPSVAAHVNTNNNDIVSWINANAAHLDGAKPFTGPVTLPGNPSAANHAANKAYVDASVPAGVISMFGGVAAPAGYLLCQGQAVSRATYAALFAAIGTAYGAGDGSTTFNLPDGRGRSPMGSGTGTGLTNRTLGGVLGAETHTLTEAQMPSHTHVQNAHNHLVSGNTSPAGGHAHGDINGGNSLLWVSPTPTLIVDVHDGGPSYGFGEASTNLVGDHTHPISIFANVAVATNQNTGSGAAHNIIHPSFVVNYIIKT